MNRPLLPAPAGPQGKTLDGISNSSLPRIKPKGRTHVAIACNGCRKLKSKCDGLKPACAKCNKDGKPCIYVTQTDALPLQALKKKHHELLESNQDQADLIRYLRQLPLIQASEVFGRLRSGEEACSLVRKLRESEMLLQLARDSSEQSQSTADNGPTTNSNINLHTTATGSAGDGD